MIAKEISGLSTISESYEIFILDLWGTIYDGQALFPEIKTLLGQLKERDKTIIFLSNSPQLPKVVYQRLERLGRVVVCRGLARFSVFRDNGSATGAAFAQVVRQSRSQQ